MERAGFVGFVLVIMLFFIGLTNDIDRLTGRGLRGQVGAPASRSRSCRLESSTVARRAAAQARGTMAEAFRITAEDHPDRVAVRTKDDEVSLTWGELRERVDALAGGLAALGVGAGDTVALMLANRPEFHLVDLAAMTLGATPFSIYQTFSPSRSSTSSATPARRSRSSSSRSPSSARGARELPDARARRSSSRRRARGHDRTAERVEGADPDFDAEPPGARSSPRTSLTLIYTSGTTGPPKGVQLTHRNLMAAVAGHRGADRVPGRRAA